MLRTPFPGGWYGSALPDGRYAILIKDKHIATEQGNVPLPPGGNLLYVDINPFGPGFAGVAPDDYAYEWNGSKYIRHEKACGMSPVIFTRAGVRISHCESEWGSQGFGYVEADGLTIMPAWKVYAWPDAGVWGYTDIGDGLYVGQGSPRGLRVWDGTVLRAINEDNPKIVRVYRVGEKVTITYWNEREVWEAVKVEITIAELRACPPAADVSEFPAPAPPPPTPQPEPAPPAEPLAVSVSVYTRQGTVPMPVSAFYDVTGHRGPVEVLLTIDGRIVGRSEEPSGRVDADADLTEPGEYRLGVTVVSLGRRAETGAVRIVRVLPAPTPTPPPQQPSPIKTGRDGYTQAGEEARAELAKD